MENNMVNPLADALVAPLEFRQDIVLFDENGSGHTGSSLFELSGKIANVLVNSGVKPGDRVAMQAEKSVYALALYFACLRAGALFLPLNGAYTSAELEYFVGDAEPAVFVCDPKSCDALEKIVEGTDTKILTLSAECEGSLKIAADQSSIAFETVSRGQDDLAAILYTSGTTGRSKGAMLSQANLLSNAQSLRDAWQFTQDDTLLHALPIFHAHGLFVAVNVLFLAGGKLIFLPKFNLDAVISAIPNVTTMMGVPTFYTRLLSDPRFTKDLTKDMRLFISGSAPLLAETHKEFEDRTGHRILERYGMTETTMSTSNPYIGDRRAGSVGLPLPGVEARIVDEQSGEELQQGEIGILEVRGPNVFKGYWRMPEKTKEEFREDGFFITGDIATVDKDGYITIVGRAKDLIITGGFNVYPKEVETEIDALAGVVESAVIGVPHPDFGEAVVAIVVAAQPLETDEAKISSALQHTLAKFKCPKSVQILSELPRNTMGKVQKNVLRDQFSSLFAD